MTTAVANTRATSTLGRLKAAARAAVTTTRADLARQLGWSWMRVDRALDENTNTNLNDMDALFGALGLRGRMTAGGKPVLTVGECRDGRAAHG